MRLIGATKAERVAEWRARLLADARQRSRGFLADRVPRWRQSGEGESTLRTYLADVAEAQGYSDTLLVSSSGEVLLAQDARAVELEPTTGRLVEQALARDEPILGEPFRCALCDEVHLDVAVRLIAPDGAQDATVLVLRSNLEDFLYPLVDSWPVLASTSETLLVRRDGDSVLFLNRVRFLSDPPLTKKIPLENTQVPAVRAVLGHAGSFEGLDYRGEKVLAELQQVPGSDWFLVAKMDSREILSEAYYRGAVAFFMAVGGIVLVVLALTLVYQGRRRAWFQHLYEARAGREKAEAQERAILYGIGDGVVATDAEGRVNCMNPVAESLTGWKESEARGLPLGSVFHIINEKSRARVESPVDRVLEEGRTVGLANHTLLVSRDGGEYPIADTAAPVFGPDGALKAVVLVFHDQTAEREALRALQVERDNLKAIMNACPVGILVFDGKGQTAAMNAKAKEMFGIQPAESARTRCGDILKCVHSHDDPAGCGRGPCCDACKMNQAVSHVLATGERLGDVEVEVEREAPNGSRRGWFRVSAEPFVLGDQRAVTVALADITEEKRAEEERLRFEAVARQNQKLESLGTLASGVAHEINNPLNVILNYGQLILDHVPQTDTVHEFATNIVQESDRVANIVRNLLAFSRVKSDEASPAQLSDIVERTLSLTRAMLRKERISLECDMEPRLPSVRCQSQQIQQVLMNLITNARDALEGQPAGGSGERRVRIRASSIEKAGVPWVRLSVEDNGHGIRPEVASRVFDPFFTTKARDRGTGLGLSISHGIVKEHQGEIWFESEPGKGATFYIDLPVMGEPSPSDATP